jgi:signal transduction histidine kinase
MKSRLFLLNVFLINKSNLFSYFRFIKWCAHYFSLSGKWMLNIVRSRSNRTRLKLLKSIWSRLKLMASLIINLNNYYVFILILSDRRLHYRRRDVVLPWANIYILFICFFLWQRPKWRIGFSISFIVWLWRLILTRSDLIECIPSNFLVISLLIAEKGHHCIFITNYKIIMQSWN